MLDCEDDDELLSHGHLSTVESNNSSTAESNPLLDADGNLRADWQRPESLTVVPELTKGHLGLVDQCLTWLDVNADGYLDADEITALFEVLLEVPMLDEDGA